jgi:hypothetical protein
VKCAVRGREPDQDGQVQIVDSPDRPRLRGIRAASAPGAPGHTSHNPPVVGSSLTRPTSDFIQNHPSLWSDLLVVKMWLPDQAR